MLPEPLVSDPESECRASDVSDALAAPRSPPLALGARVILLLAVSASPPHWPQLRGPGRFIGVGARDTGASPGVRDRRVSVKTCQVDKWTSCMMEAY